MSYSIHFLSFPKPLIFIDSTPKPPSEKKTRNVAQKRFRESSSPEPSSKKLSLPKESLRGIQKGLKSLELAQYEKAVDAIIEGYEAYPEVGFVQSLLRKFSTSSIEPINILSFLDKSLPTEKNRMGCSLLKSLAHYKMNQTQRAEFAKDHLVQTSLRQRGSALLDCLRYCFLIQISAKKIRRNDPSALVELREAFNVYPARVALSLHEKLPNFENLLPPLCKNAADHEFVRLLLNPPSKFKMEMGFLLI